MHKKKETNLMRREKKQKITPHELEIIESPEHIRMGILVSILLLLKEATIFICKGMLLPFAYFMGYVVVPLSFLILVTALISHSYIWLESKAVTEVQATYYGAIDYIASMNNLVKVQELPLEPVIESTPEDQRSLSFVIHTIREDMTTLEIPDVYEPIFLALAYHESITGDPFAQSPVGAMGFFQIMPATAKGLGYHPNEMWNLRKNIRAGVGYMWKMLQDNNMDLILALKEYNAGKKRIDMSQENRRFPHHVLSKLPYVYAEENWKGLTGKK